MIGLEVICFVGSIVVDGCINSGIGHLFALLGLDNGVSNYGSDEFYRTHCDFTVCNNGARELCEVYSELRKKIGVR